MRGSGDGPVLAIVGHIDEIGLIVHHIDDDGFLWFTAVGGWDTVVLVGQRLEVLTRDGAGPGVVGKRPIHLLDGEERKKAPELKHLHIDIGAKDGDDARSMVRIGDVAVIAGEPVEFPNGRLVSRSMDNRLGCYVAYEAARLVAEAGDAAADVCALAVTQEEITFAGARTTAFTLEPDLVVVVDVTFATDQPDLNEKELGRHRFGSGPVIQRGSTLDPQLFELLHETAEAEEIPFTVTASARSTGTDADAHPRRRAAASRARSSRSRCATCTRRSRWCRWTTWRTRRGCSPRSRGGSRPACRSSGDAAAPAALGHRRHAAPARVGGARGGDAARRWCRCTARSSLDGHQVEAAGRTDGAIARDLLIAAGHASEAIDARADDVIAACCALYDELCPADLSPRLAPGRAEALASLGGAAGRVPLLAGHRQLRAHRAAQARAGGDRRLVPGGAGRLRLRRRGPRAAPADRAGARGRLAARADGRDRRHAARHRVRAGGRAARGRGGDGAVRRRGARPDADAVVDSAAAVVPVLVGPCRRRTHWALSEPRR